MKVKFLGVLLMFIVVFAMDSCSPVNSEIPNSITSSQAVTMNYSYSSPEKEAMNLINAYRASIGLNSLEQNNYISYKSEEHDNYMIINNVVNHYDFVARSQNIMNVLGAKTVSENVAYDYNTPKSTLDAWLNSPEHKACIEGDFTHFGISIRADSAGKKYYTNIFVKI